ncbi:hypothetical protein B0T14DRAFT_580207 [Immersiella caudata]|uniref:Uncharacterized protein n=1 Tax=Immersiella caudata TaxID=314043 RepID=A0AA39X6V8_9PEZI|nr:hypothetical protein B0T14DRAFT_580207 [Immersiella caudata]
MAPQDSDLPQVASWDFNLPEVDRRGETNLEVHPLSPGKEVSSKEVSSKEVSSEEVLSKSHDDSESTLTPPAAVSQKRSRRFWILLSISMIVVAGVIAGSVAGPLLAARRSASQETADGHQNSSDTANTSSPSSPDNKQNTTSATTRPSKTSLTTTSTSTPTADVVPTFPVRIGNAAGSSFRSTVSFLDDGTALAPCHYTTVLEVDGPNPCGIPFNLTDGLEYVWNGCGAETWVTWRDPVSDGKAHFMGNCASDPKTWECDGGVVVKGNWLCRAVVVTENLTL